MPNNPTLPNPLNVAFGTGCVLIRWFTDSTGFGVIIKPSKDGPHSIGEKIQQEAYTGRHEPKQGEIYLHFSNMESYEVLRHCLTQARRMYNKHQAKGET